MQTAIDELERVFAGREVLGVMAVLLLASGITASSPFVHGGEVLAGAVAHLAPALAGGLIELLIVVGIYLQAVVLAALYRAARGVYRALQRRANRARSA